MPERDKFNILGPTVMSITLLCNISPNKDILSPLDFVGVEDLWVGQVSFSLIEAWFRSFSATPCSFTSRMDFRNAGSHQITMNVS